jgi:branched-chain amino acid transport system permease protein
VDLRRYLPLGVLVLAAAALHAALVALGAPYCMTQLTMAAGYSLVVIGLCLLVGYAGQASLGHAAFFAIGGYTSAVLTTTDLLPYAGSAWAAALDGLGLLLERQDAYGRTIVHVSPPAALFAALLAAALVAFVVGIPVLRLRGHYLAMATLGFGIIVHRVLLGTPAFGGADGISGVPPFPILGSLEVSGSPALRVGNYYLAWLLVAAAVALSINLVRSRVGRALRAIHENEEAALSLGIAAARCKLAVFVLSAVLAAAGGVFLTHFIGGIGPSEAGVMKSVRYLAIVAVGGMAHIWGTLFMGILLNFLSLRGVFGSYDDAVFGGILIAIMLFAPQGLFRLRPIEFLRATIREKAHGRAAP